MKLRNTFAAACAIALIAAAPVFAAKTLIKDNALASYYGAQYHGRPTSSGEIFDMYGMSAAHRTLPFGTMLEITNLENGSSAIVRVNDRGPFVEGREIDVSLGAAEKLGMIASGVARVSISILDDAEVNARAALQKSAAAPNAVAAKVEQPMTVGQPANDMPVQVVQALSVQPAAVAQPVPATQYPAPVTQPVTPVQPLNLLPPYPQPAAEAPAAPAATPIAPAVPATPSYENAAPAATPIAPAVPATPSYESAAPAASTYPPAAPADTAAIEPPDAPVWRVQLGAFMREENAIRLVRQIRAVGIEPAYERTGDSIRVVIAGVKDADLESVKSTLEGAGLYDYILRREK